MWRIFIKACLSLLLLLGGVDKARADGLTVEQSLLPVHIAGQDLKLETMIVRPADGKRHPLLLLAHGSPRNPAIRRQRHPNSMMAQARGLARLGWAVVVPMRRGYGNSEGEGGDGYQCDDPDYVAAGRHAAEDLRAVSAALAARSDIDTTQTLAIGLSAGGLASVALAADPPPGLRAVISFAGGRGSRAPGDVCGPERLVAAFGVFGQTARVPMMWVYAENDQFFAPPLVRSAHAAFGVAGGQAELMILPPFGKDGHFLFSLAGRTLWQPLVRAFLTRTGLPYHDVPMPPPPAGLSDQGQEAFQTYLEAASPKAFAIGTGQVYAYQYGSASGADAQRQALEDCQRRSSAECRIAMIDNDATP